MWYGSVFNGSINDFYYFNTALTGAQIQQLYKAPNVPGSYSPASALQVAVGGVFDISGLPQTIASLADGVGGGGIVTNNGAACGTHHRVDRRSDDLQRLDPGWRQPALVAGQRHRHSGPRRLEHL